ncbi:MAG TPA: PAS domain S-box protein [Verrucomicrobiae bacterium]|jgi:PAS domain S-box-containing protein
MSSAGEIQPIRQWTFTAWQKAMLFGVGFYICAVASIYLSPRGGVFMTFWLPAGFYLAVLLLSEYRDWPWLAAGALLGNIIFDYELGTKPAVICLYFVANAGQAMTGAWMIRRFISKRPTLRTLNEFTWLVLLVGILAPIIWAIPNAEALKYFGLSHSFGQSFETLWGTNAVGILMLTPLILVWASRQEGSLAFFDSRNKIIEAAILFIGLNIGMWYLLFMENGAMSPNKSVVIPFLLWAGLRFGTLGASATNLYLALVFSFFTTQFHSGITPAQAATGIYVFVLQTVLVTGALISLIPAIVIAERDRSLAALQASESRFRTLIEQAPVAIGISRAGKTIYVNKKYLDAYGHQRMDDLAGKPIFEHWAPEFRPIIEERVRLREQGKPAPAEYEGVAQRKDGSKFPVHVTVAGVSLPDGPAWLAFITDITARQRAEQALRESEEKFSKAFRASPNGMSISEIETGRFVEINEGYCQIYGYQRDEMLDHTALELQVWEDPLARARFVKELRQEGMVRNFEARTRTRAGEVKLILLSAEPIEVAGKACIVSVLHDITDRKHAETEKEAAIAREHAARLEYTLQLIASQEAERTRIASELHDSLGQDLLLIKNRAQLALMGKDIDGELYEQIEAISGLATQSIAEARSISHDLHPYQLDHLGLTQALKAMIEKAEESSGVDFKRKFDGVDDLFSKEAALNLYRVVQESLNNILKHSRARNVRITLERDVHDVQLTIEDDGCGFNSKMTGKGMGLKNIAERSRILGGMLRVDSRPGRGTYIEIIIPISAEAE